MHTKNLSPRQREMVEREGRILESARSLLLNEGYYATTMDRIAEASGCPKGTMYQCFACKEDIILALALQAHRKRMSFVRRGVSFSGRPRERMVAAGEGTGLFAQLNPEESRILHLATGPIREKGSPQRLQAIQTTEREVVGLLRDVLVQAVAQGDLDFGENATIEEITYALCALIDGAYTLAESGLPQYALGLQNPKQEMWWMFNRLADAYGWRPRFSEQDWEETLAEIRRTVFPEEAQRLYGPGAWYGDAGCTHPGTRRHF